MTPKSNTNVANELRRIADYHLSQSLCHGDEENQQRAKKHLTWAEIINKIAIEKVAGDMHDT